MSPPPAHPPTVFPAHVILTRPPTIFLCFSFVPPTHPPTVLLAHHVLPLVRHVPVRVLVAPLAMTQPILILTLVAPEGEQQKQSTLSLIQSTQGAQTSPLTAVCYA
jgi:hypothetical protein